jgi:hypothetical protein
MKIHGVKTLVPEPNFFMLFIVLQNFSICKSELIQAGGETLCSEINNFIKVSLKYGRIVLALEGVYYFTNLEEECLN